MFSGFCNSILNNRPLAKLLKTCGNVPRHFVSARHSNLYFRPQQINGSHGQFMGIVLGYNPKL